MYAPKDNNFLAHELPITLQITQIESWFVEGEAAAICDATGAVGSDPSEGSHGRGEPLEAAAPLTRVCGMPRPPQLWGGLLVHVFTYLSLGCRQPSDGASAEGAERWRRRAESCAVGLVVTAQGKSAVSAHLVPAVPHLNRADLFETDAAELDTAPLRLCIIITTCILIGMIKGNK